MIHFVLRSVEPACLFSQIYHVVIILVFLAAQSVDLVIKLFLNAVGRVRISSRVIDLLHIKEYLSCQKSITASLMLSSNANN